MILISKRWIMYLILDKCPGIQFFFNCVVNYLFSLFTSRYFLWKIDWLVSPLLSMGSSTWSNNASFFISKISDDIYYNITLGRFLVLFVQCIGLELVSITLDLRFQESTSLNAFAVSHLSPKSFYSYITEIMVVHKS